MRFLAAAARRKVFAALQFCLQAPILGGLAAGPHALLDRVEMAFPDRLVFTLPEGSRHDQEADVALYRVQELALRPKRWILKTRANARVSLASRTRFAAMRRCRLADESRLRLGATSCEIGG